MEEEGLGLTAMADVKPEEISPLNGDGIKTEQDGLSPASNGSLARSGDGASADEKKRRNGSAPTPDNGSTPKLPRKDSQKAAGQGRSPRLFDHLPDATQEAYGHFQVINDCLYGSRHMGSSEHDALDCDCAEEWRKYPVLMRGARV